MTTIEGGSGIGGYIRGKVSQATERLFPAPPPINPVKLLQEEIYTMARDFADFNRELDTFRNYAYYLDRRGKVNEAREQTIEGIAQRIAFDFPDQSAAILQDLSLSTRYLQGKGWDSLTEEQHSILVVSQRISSRVKLLMDQKSGSQQKSL